MSALLQPFPMLAGRRAQVWRHKPAFRRPRHFHDEPEINAVVAGTAVLGVGDRVVRVCAGEMLLFQPGQDHVLIDASPDLDLFVFALRPELAERAVGLRALASGRCSPLPIEDVERLSGELDAVSQLADPIATETRVADLFVGAVERAPGAHVLSRRALELARIEPDLSGTVLARRLATAPSLLSRKFHDEIGVPLVEFRARVKLLRFVELVDAGASLTRAALDAEFGSYAQCHRVFRRALGCAPQAYFAGERVRVDARTAR